MCLLRLQAIKLTERAIQYADTAAHTRRALSERCRLAFVEGEDGDIESFSAKLRTEAIPDAVTEVVRAQAFIKMGMDYEGPSLACLYRSDVIPFQARPSTEKH
jgi:hypothetical protein